jgi:predicted nucleotidyltransferase
MDRKKTIIGKLKEFKENVEKDMRIEKMILFGSYAKGKIHRWSDIDLIIVSPKFKKLNFFKRGAKMYDYWTLDYPVDFICFTPEEFNKRKKQITIVREALKNGIAI